MQLGIPYAKTALGRAYLDQPPMPGSRARRSVLIMMDGRKTMRSLMPAIRSLGMRTADVQALVTQGLLAPALAIEQVMPPDLELTQPPRQVVESKSLVVAKLFALDLLARGVDASIVGRDGSTLTSILERVTRNSPGDADYSAFVTQLATHKR